jgi:putative oxidoreductase
MKNLILKIYGSFPDCRKSIGLLLLRVIVGLAFVQHGWGKIQTPFSWMGPDAPVPGFFQFLAALSEFGGGLAITFGLVTPLALLGILSTMTVALLMVHIPAGHPWVGSGQGPSYELPLAYWTVAVTLLLTGPGKFSLDALLIETFQLSPKDSAGHR